MDNTAEEIIESSPIQNESSWKSTRKYVRLAFLSALIPGLGQIILREKRRAAVLFALFLAVWMMYMPLRVPASYFGLIATVWLELLLSFFSGLMLILRKQVRWRAIWVVALIPFVLLSAVVLGNLGLRVAGLKIYNIPSTSMEPTIVRGDSIIVDQQYFANHALIRGDVIVFQRQGTAFVKRAVGVSGDVVEIRDGELYVNDELQQESYVQHIGTGDPLPQQLKLAPIKIAVSTVFVMGDNRDISLDSRFYGAISMKQVTGKPLYILSSAKDRSGTNLK